jgi:methyl-accepting chemotaxis protein
VVSYSSTSDIIYNTLKSNLEGRASDGAEIVASKVKSLLLDIEGVTYITEIQSMNWEIQKNVLLDAIKRTGTLRMGVADLNGKSYFTDGSTADLSDRDYIKIAQQGITNITDPEVSKIDNKLVIIIAAPIKDSAGMIKGVLVATYDNTAFSNTINEIKIGKEGYSFVINKQGIKVAHKKNELVINRDNDIENVKSDPNLNELVDVERKMINGERGFGEYTYGGIRKFLAFSPIKDTEWSIGLTVSKDEFYADLYSLRTKIIIVTIMFILFAIAAIIFISRYLISIPIRKLINLSDKMTSGDVSVNIESDSKDEIGMLKSSFGKMILNIREQSENARKIADGELNFVINQRSENDILAKSMKQVVETLKNLVSESNNLTHEVSEGKLDSRGNTDAFKGGYADIVKGINNTLDAVDMPIREASNVLGNMAVNDYSIEMTGKYKGVFANFSEKVNLVRSRLLSAQDIAIRISKGDTSRLEEFKKIGKRSDNDKLVPSFTEMMETINNLIIEVGMLTRSASDGDLDTRGDSSKFEGGYKEVIEGVNKTMDAIAKPLDETLRVLAHMAENDFTFSINGSYNGAFHNLTNSINNVEVTLNSVLNEINSAAEQVSTGSRQVSSSVTLTRLYRTGQFY